MDYKFEATIAFKESSVAFSASDFLAEFVRPAAIQVGARFPQGTFGSYITDSNGEILATLPE